MYINREDKEYIISELVSEFHAKLDGGRKNLIFPVCPYCGHEGGKFGVFVGTETSRKKLFMSHCFSCGHTTTELNQLLRDLGRSDLIVEETVSFEPLQLPEFFQIKEDEIDDSLKKVEMPEGWKRCFKNSYLKSRGFTFDDFDFFPVGTTRGLNFRFDNYVVFPIIDDGVTVGYVARHIWDKDRIDEHNRRARLQGKYEIRRYNNSGFREEENEFVKLLYNIDLVVEDVTDTVILCEGIFDVIALTRKLNLYENPSIVPVATFGKKISDAQIYKLQSKGVRTIIVGYDGDACSAIKNVAQELNEYFDVYVAYIPDPSQDFDSMDFWDIYDVFSTGLMTPIEYTLKVVQL